MRRILFFIFILVFLSPVFLSSIEIEQGKVKLTLHDSYGRFSLSYIDSNKDIPLLFARDPRTTVLSILVDNSVYRMGESAGFKQNISRTTDGAKITWTGSNFNVIEEFTLVSPFNGNTKSGVKISISVENKTQKKLDIGLRYLFDTYLSERQNNHFYLGDKQNGIKDETELTSYQYSYWISPDPGNSNSVGFLGMLKGSGTTRPDRVVFANWQRLNESSWSFSPKDNRSFSIPPYSNNDSAVAYFYTPTEIFKGDMRKITLYIGNFDKDGYKSANDTDRDKTQGVASLYEETASATDNGYENGSQSNTSSASKELDRVERAISEIDSLIYSSSTVTEDELSMARKLVNELESRKKNFSD